MLPILLLKMLSITLPILLSDMLSNRLSISLPVNLSFSYLIVTYIVI